MKKLTILTIAIMAAFSFVLTGCHQGEIGTIAPRTVYEPGGGSTPPVDDNPPVVGDDISKNLFDFMPEVDVVGILKTSDIVTAPFAGPLVGLLRDQMTKSSTAGKAFGVGAVKAADELIANPESTNFVLLALKMHWGTPDFNAFNLSDYLKDDAIITDSTQEQLAEQDVGADNETYPTEMLIVYNGVNANYADQFYDMFMNLVVRPEIRTGKVETIEDVKFVEFIGPAFCKNDGDPEYKYNDTLPQGILACKKPALMYIADTYGNQGILDGKTILGGTRGVLETYIKKMKGDTVSDKPFVGSNVQKALFNLPSNCSLCMAATMPFMGQLDNFISESPGSDISIFWHTIWKGTVNPSLMVFGMSFSFGGDLGYEIDYYGFDMDHKAASTSAFVDKQLVRNVDWAGLFSNFDVGEIFDNEADFNANLSPTSITMNRTDSKEVTLAITELDDIELNEITVTTNKEDNCGGVTVGRKTDGGTTESMVFTVTTANATPGTCRFIFSAEGKNEIRSSQLVITIPDPCNNTSTNMVMVDEDGTTITSIELEKGGEAKKVGVKAIRNGLPIDITLQAQLGSGNCGSYVTISKDDAQPAVDVTYYTVSAIPQNNSSQCSLYATLSSSGCPNINLGRNLPVSLLLQAP